MKKIISWLGTITSIIGAFMVASQIIFFGYCAFIIGSVSWLIIGIINKDKPLIVLNGTFFVANLIGLYNAF
jgi:hypothetical protein